ARGRPLACQEGRSLLQRRDVREDEGLADRLKSVDEKRGDRDESHVVHRDPDDRRTPDPLDARTGGGWPRQRKTQLGRELLFLLGELPLHHVGHGANLHIGWFDADELNGRSGDVDTPLPSEWHPESRGERMTFTVSIE